MNNNERDNIKEICGCWSCKNSKILEEYNVPTIECNHPKCDQL